MVATGLSTNRYRPRGPSSLLPQRDISPSTYLPNITKLCQFSGPDYNIIDRCLPR